MLVIIAAYDKNKLIGNKGKLPWSIPSDLENFKKITLGGLLIMGRKTYESIGRPLPNRFTIVISKTKDFFQKDCACVKSFEEALSLAGELSLTKTSKKDIYVCGGSKVYEEALPYADKMIITHVDGSFEGDTFFPDFDYSDYILEKSVERNEKTDSSSYRINTYLKKSKFL